MSKYTITNKTIKRITCTESAGTVTNASDAIDWAVGLPFGYLLNYCKLKGWMVTPIVDEDMPQYFDFKGARYILEWDNRRIVRMSIIEDGEEREISWAELPEQLKGLL